MNMHMTEEFGLESSSSEAPVAKTRAPKKDGKDTKKAKKAAAKKKKAANKKAVKKSI